MLPSPVSPVYRRRSPTTAIRFPGNPALRARCRSRERSVEIGLFHSPRRLHLARNTGPGACKLTARLGNSFTLRLRDFREHRQRQHLVRGRFGVWKVSRLVSQVGIRGQQMNGDRVVNSRLYALGVQSFLPCGPLRRAHGIDVIDMAGMWGCIRSRNSASREEPLVVRGGRAPAFSPLLEVLQLNAQHGALDALEAIVIALEDVLVLLLRAPVT